MAGEVSFVDMGNGFSLVKSIDCAGVSKDNAGVSVAKFIVFSAGKRIFNPVREKFLYALLWLWLPRPVGALE